MILPDENPLHSCRAIAHFLGAHDVATEASRKVREGLERDLCWKLSKLDPLDRATVMAESWYGCLPGQVRKECPSDRLPLHGVADLLKEKKAKKDVGIVTVIPPELRATLTALGCDPEERERESSAGFRYWHADVPRSEAPPLSVVVTNVGEPRNVPCAICVAHMLSRFDLGMVMLVGIAAGPREYVKLGDVVWAERVYDYEHVRLEIRRFLGIHLFFRAGRPRPLYINTPKTVLNALGSLGERQMQSYYTHLLDRLGPDDLPASRSDQSPSLHKGTIAAGEKLIADGSLKRMLRADQRIRAADQEDSGFAQVCEFKKLNWCIFRGICDYADPSKGDRWHLGAALASAAAAVSFLKTRWRPEAEAEGG